MPPNTDKFHGAGGQGREFGTREASSRGSLKFVTSIGALVVLVLILCWGMLRSVSARLVQARPAVTGSITGKPQSPTAPQLQASPRQDWLNLRAKQVQKLESYGWENRDTQTVHVPIERAMELLLQKGLPVANPAAPQAQQPAAKGNQKP